MVDGLEEFANITLQDETRFFRFIHLVQKYLEPIDRAVSALALLTRKRIGNEPRLKNWRERFKNHVMHHAITHHCFVDYAWLWVVDPEFVVRAVLIRSVYEVIVEREEVVAQAIFKFLHVALFALADFESSHASRMDSKDVAFSKRLEYNRMNYSWQRGVNELALQFICDERTRYIKFLFSMKSMSQFETEAPILQKSVDLYKELYEHLKTFPKKDQYLLGKRCEDAMLDFLECVLFAASANGSAKLQALQKANAKFDLLKTLLRVARELKMLDNKKYLLLETKIQDIGRQLGGWIKSTVSKAS